MASAKHIAVGIDGSSNAGDAALWAAGEAARRGVDLLLLHSPAAAAPAGGRAVLEAASELVRQQFPELTVWAESHMLPPVAMLRVASEEALMTVVGSHGSHRVIDTVLGSVAWRLVNRARGPVVVCCSPTGPAEISNTSAPVVVGVDGSPESSSALKFGFEEASSRGARLIAVRVWDDRILDGYWGNFPVPVDRAEIDRLQLGFLNKQMEPRARAYPNVPTEGVVLRGRTAAALLKPIPTAQGEIFPALVVVGSHGFGKLTGLRMGSTGHALITHAGCPVAVVPSERVPDPATTRSPEEFGVLRRRPAVS